MQGGENMEGLRKKRKDKGITQMQAAKDLNLATQTYRNYEYGEREPKLETLKEMAKYFDCSVDELL